MLGKGLAAKAERGNPGEILRAPDLARGVASEGQLRIGAVHATAVVIHSDQAHSALRDRDTDAGGLGVEGIFNQLLDDRGRAFDNLSSGDLIDEIVR